METITTIQSTDTLIQEAEKEIDIRGKLSAFIDSHCSVYGVSGKTEMTILKEIAEHYELKSVLENLSKISV